MNQLQPIEYQAEIWFVFFYSSLGPAFHSQGA